MQRWKNNTDFYNLPLRMWSKMEAKSLFTRELKQLAPLKCECGSEITSEKIKEWAVEIGQKVFESDESMSSGEG